MIEANERIETQAPESVERGSDMLERINGIAIREDMLARSANALGAMPAEMRNDFDLRILTLVAALKGLHPEDGISLAAIAIDFRLRALVRLVEMAYVPGCRMDPAKQRPLLSQAALRAACDEKLAPNAAGLASFDAAAFKARLLH